MNRYRLTLYVLTGIWLAVIAFAAYLVLSAEIGRRERDFGEAVQTMAGQIKDKLDTNEAVLAGFAAFLQAVEHSDAEAATRYAASVTASYPHIYMLEVARRVPVAEQETLQAQLRETLHPGFRLKEFPAITQRAAPSAGAAQYTWPILFMYPALPEAQEIYGVRLETVDYLAHTLALAAKSHRPVASPVFKMFEGGYAYILLQEVDRSARPQTGSGPNLFGTTMTALMLIKTDSLRPVIDAMPAGQSSISLAASMTSPGAAVSPLFLLQAPAPGALAKALLPHFRWQIQVDNRSQPTSLQFEQQLTWEEVVTPEFVTILGLLACALVTVPALTYRHYQALARGAREHERSAYLATHDMLTDLPNRFLFVDRFEQAVRQHSRYGTPFALLLVDLDFFKDINDNHGHEVGDEILVAIARRMSREIRACDTVARQGGDEFIVLLANTLNSEDALLVGDKLKTAIAAPIDTSAGPLTVRCSVGVAMYPAHGQTLDLIRRAADQAMYSAKKAGRDVVAVCGEGA